MRLPDLWAVSLALSLFSLLIIAALIVARLMSERRAAELQRQRARLVPMLLNGAAPPDLDGISIGLLAEISVDFIRMVRGDERDAFVDTASALGVPAYQIRRLRRGTVHQRTQAAYALTRFPGDDVTDALSATLTDKHPHVRFAAAMALAQSGRAPPVRYLIDRLDLGEEENSLLITDLFREIAAYDPQSIEELLPQRHVATPIKGAAIRALSGLRGFALAPIVNSLALDMDEDNPQLPNFLRALGQFQHPAGIPAVEKCLDASISYVRAAAAQAAGQIGMEQAAGRIAELMYDEDWWVRFRAGEALTRLGRPGVGHLREWACMGAEPAKSAARLTLAEKGIAR